MQYGYHITVIKQIMHYNDVIMGAIASQITSLTIVYSTVYSDADQRKQQSSGSLAFVRVIHQWSVNSPHKWPVTRKLFPFDDVFMVRQRSGGRQHVAFFIAGGLCSHDDNVLWHAGVERNLFVRWTDISSYKCIIYQSESREHQREMPAKTLAGERTILI